MKRILVFSSLVALAFAQSPSSIGRRVYGGVLVQPTEVPYQVSFQKRQDSSHFCGGSIITEKWVISAAHCFVAISSDNLSGKIVDKSLIKIIAGTVNLTEPRYTYYPKQIIVHKDYGVASYLMSFDDISLTEISGEFENNDYIRPVNLPRQNENFPPGLPVLVTGWGKTEFMDYPSDLRKATLLIADQYYCHTFVKKLSSVFFDSDPQMCAYDPSGYRDACMGDSGGPMVVNNILVGITSYGTGKRCADDKFYTVYTRVSAYVNWIEKNIDENN